jgi:hypothetical protein
MKLSTLAVVMWAAPASSSATTHHSNTSPSNLPAETCEDFNTGVYLGVKVAESIWQSMGGSCSNVWGFEEEVDDHLDDYYPTDTSNWRTNSCNQGVEAGADQVVEKYEKQCLDDSPDECYDLGQAAAQRKLFHICLMT